MSIGEEYAQSIIGAKAKGGRMRKIQNIKSVRCAFCGGTGQDRKLRTVCQICKGEGTISVNPPIVSCLICCGRGKMSSNLSCLACKGSGVVSVRKGAKVCSECHGRGRIGEGVFSCTGCSGQGIC